VTSMTKESETMTTSETTITTTTTSSGLEFATISSSFVLHGTLLHVSILEAAQAAFANITAQFRLRNAVMSSKQDLHLILLEGLADVTHSWRLWRPSWTRRAPRCASTTSAA